MLYNTHVLTGPALDYAVALAEGLKVMLHQGGRPVVYHPGAPRWVPFRPSQDWAVGGPIFEREHISPMYEPSLVYDDTWRWKAHASNADVLMYGPTPLIAAMRCYVASKLGETVDLPEELLS